MLVGSAIARIEGVNTKDSPSLAMTAPAPSSMSTLPASRPSAIATTTSRRPYVSMRLPNID